MSRKLTIKDAINEALRQEMDADPRVLLFGEDIAGGAGRDEDYPDAADAWGGPFGVTKGLLPRFGRRRVVDTALAETGFIGASIGAAIAGLRPVAEIMYIDFIGTSFDQLLNQAAKLRYVYGGKVSVPIVVRTVAGAGFRAAAEHSQALYSLYTHVPGLKVVAPATADDAKGLLQSAIRDPNPVCYMEHKGLYRHVKGEVPDGEHTVQIGEARVAREGEEMTVIAYGSSVALALQAAEELDEDIEVLDLRTLYPLDTEAVLATARKTGKVLVAHEATQSCGVGAEVTAVISEHAFEDLDAPVRRLTTPDVPIPFSPPLEQRVLPQLDDMKEACRGLLAY